MNCNFRCNQDVPYFATDVCLAQYHLMSEKYGFAGQLPSRIVRSRIFNPETLSFFALADGVPSLEAFLCSTVNGRHTQRMLDALRMEATRLEWDARSMSATVHVRPLP